MDEGEYDNRGELRVSVAVRIRPRLERPNHPERYDATCTFTSIPDKGEDVLTPGRQGQGQGAAHEASSSTNPSLGDGPSALALATSGDIDPAAAGNGVLPSITIVNPESKDAHTFAYDLVFEQNDGQDTVFDTSVVRPITEVLEEGTHFTVVTYGQTGSGKTFTLLGEPPVREREVVSPVLNEGEPFPAPRRSSGGRREEPLESPGRSPGRGSYVQLHPDSGVYLRMMNQILNYKFQHRNRAHIIITLSVVEIYNDTIRDLLRQKSSVQFREIGEDLLLVNQARVEIKTQSAVLDYFEIAYKNRAVCQTQMNDESSRSHALFFIDVFQQLKTSNNPDPPDINALAEHHVQSLLAAQNVGKVQQPGLSDRILGATRREESTGGVGRKSGDPSFPEERSTPSNDFNLYPITHSRVVLVDLAGSERIKRSGVTGAQLSEALYVNRSLSALGHVVNHLCQGSKHIPFRDSKMTRILRNSFVVQHSRILFITNISPAASSFGETLGSLRFASRLKDLKPPQQGANTYVASSLLEETYLKKQQTMEELCAEIRVIQSGLGHKRVLRNEARPYRIPVLSAPYVARQGHPAPSTLAVRSAMIAHRQREEKKTHAEEQEKADEYENTVNHLVLEQQATWKESIEAKIAALNHQGEVLSEGHDSALSSLNEFSGLIEAGEREARREQAERNAVLVALRKEKAQIVEVSRGIRHSIDYGRREHRELHDDAERLTEEIRQTKKEMQLEDEDDKRREHIVSLIAERIQSASALVGMKLEVALCSKELDEWMEELEQETSRRRPASRVSERKLEQAKECQSVPSICAYFTKKPLRPAVYTDWGPSPPPSPTEDAEEALGSPTEPSARHRRQPSSGTPSEASTPVLPVTGPFHTAAASATLSGFSVLSVATGTGAVHQRLETSTPPSLGLDRKASSPTLLLPPPRFELPPKAPMKEEAPPVGTKQPAKPTTPISVAPTPTTVPPPIATAAVVPPVATKKREVGDGLPENLLETNKSAAAAVPEKKPISFVRSHKAETPSTPPPQKEEAATEIVLEIPPLHQPPPSSPPMKRQKLVPTERTPGGTTNPTPTTGTTPVKGMLSPRSLKHNKEKLINVLIENLSPLAEGSVNLTPFHVTLTLQLLNEVEITEDGIRTFCAGCENRGITFLQSPATRESRLLQISGAVHGYAALRRALQLMSEEDCHKNSPLVRALQACSLLTGLNTSKSSTSPSSPRGGNKNEPADFVPYDVDVLCDWFVPGALRQPSKMLVSTPPNGPGSVKIVKGGSSTARSVPSNIPPSPPAMLAAASDPNASSIVYFLDALIISLGL